MAHGILCFIPAKAFCTRCQNYAQAIPGLDLQQVGVGVCSPQCCMLLPTLCQDFASGCQNSHHASHATFHLLQENGHLPGKAKVGPRTTRAMLRDSHESLAQGIPELWTFGLHEVRIDLRRLRGLRAPQQMAPVPGPLHRASRPLPRNRMPRRIGSEMWPRRRAAKLCERAPFGLEHLDASLKRCNSGAKVAILAWAKQAQSPHVTLRPTTSSLQLME